MCVHAYEGPNCSNVTEWQGKVTLCLEGKAIRGVEMKTRGHVSEMFPKKQFALKLPQPMALMGMKPATDWVLATSYIDTSFQRNPLAFDIYRLQGGWAPSTRYVNLRWQGSDNGLYYIGEKPDVSDNRIHLPKSKPHDPAESAFLLTADWNKTGELAVETPNTSTIFNVIYPPRSQVSPAQLSFLRRLLAEVDRRALVRSASPGPGSLEEILDFPSFARYYVLQELAKDTDGYAFSNYMSVQAGRLYHSAPWDFDLAFHFDCTPVYYTNIFTGKVLPGAAGWNVENARSMGYWTGWDGYGDGIWDFGSNKRLLFTHIWKHPRFAEAFVAAWRAARQGPLTDTVLRGLVRRRSEEIDASALRDIGIWRSSQRCGFWRCCSPEASQDFRSATRDLESYLLDRARWMDAHVGDLIAK